MHGFARNSFKTIDIRVRQSTGTLMMHSYMVSELFLEQARTPVWKRSWRNLQIQGGVLGEPWKRGGVKKVFLLKQSVKTIETKLQKTLYLFHMISASQGKTVTDFQSSILASAFIMQLKNRNIKVNSIIVSLQDFQWKMSIILPNPARDKCTIKFISRKKICLHWWTCMLFLYFKKSLYPHIISFCLSCLETQSEMRAPFWNSANASVY